MTSRERLSALIVVLLIFCAGFGTGYWSGEHNYEKDHAVCTEDMSCWNCTTMGNHVCGHVK